MIEGALFESGRPVIVVPHIQKQGLKLDRVHGVLGRRPHRRARDRRRHAVPQRAKAVEVVVVTDDRDKSDEITGANMSRAPGAPRRRGRRQAHHRAATSTCRAPSSRTPPTAAPISS